MASQKLQVAVVGAGAAGLCVARHILASPETFAPPMVFEASGCLGGTWVYLEEEAEGRPTHSSMYRDLRTNLPKEVMAFPDFPFDPALPSFLHHSDVLAYLESYAEHFGVYDHIQFRSEVSHIRPVSSSEGQPGGWEVTATQQRPETTQKVTKHFDAVMVCTGPPPAQPLLPAPGALCRAEGGAGGRRPLRSRPGAAAGPSGGAGGAEPPGPPSPRAAPGRAAGSPSGSGVGGDSGARGRLCTAGRRLDPLHGLPIPLPLPGSGAAGLAGDGVWAGAPVPAPAGPPAPVAVPGRRLPADLPLPAFPLPGALRPGGAEGRLPAALRRRDGGRCPSAAGPAPAPGGSGAALPSPPGPAVELRGGAGPPRRVPPAPAGGARDL
ncbi:collagen alpha-1(I) chain-like isoform X2 [Podarcis raffonei]|uniref:collagen alpha-1(I) chain-like isoform X2 n=1 Tax=Podarcis raffonei TaxID=65483 RepID=UPI0023297767|nr:collagen alpha-1(I) chain-like isoform X2 [Podarcis raffonei]